MQHEAKRSKLSTPLDNTGVTYDTSSSNIKSYVKRRVQKKQEFLTSIGVKDQGLSAPRTSRCKIHVGNEYIDPQTSYLSFDLRALYLAETNLKLAVDTHPISLIKRVTVFDSKNKELFTIDYLNKCIVQYWGSTKSKHFLENTLGWGKYDFTWDPSVSGSSETKNMQCVIPLAMLGGFFETSSPLPPQLMSELIIEIDWEDPLLALVLRPEAPLESDEWQIADSNDDYEIFNRNLITYEFRNLVLISDCWEMDSQLHNQLTDKYANGGGIEIQFKSFTNQVQNIFNLNSSSGTDQALSWQFDDQSKEKIEIPITQSFSRASKVTLFTWPEFQATKASGSFVTEAASGSAAWWSSSFHQLCTSYHQNFDNFITKYRTRVHNYYLPQHEETATLVPYTDDPVQILPNQRWKKKFLDGVSHNTIRSNLETQDENASVNGKQWSKPWVVRLNRTFHDSGVLDVPPDLMSEDSVRIDFEYPVALQLEFRPIQNERNVIYNGWMKYEGVDETLSFLGSPEEENHYLYWNAQPWNKYEVRSLVSIEHNVVMKITPRETFISK